MNNILNVINQLSQNPMQIFSRYGIPTDCKTPESVADYLVKSGRVNQNQINQATQMYNQLFKR